MVNNYPLIYKTRVCEYYFKYKSIKTINEILTIFNISNVTLYNWINKYTVDELKEKQKYNKISIFTPEIKCFIRSYIKKHIDFDYKKLIKSIKRKYKILMSK